LTISCPDGPDKGHPPEWHSGPSQSRHVSGISGPKDPDNGVFRLESHQEGRMRKMNEKLLSIGIALMILALVAAPAAAALPDKSPLPPGNPFNIIWNLLQNLQAQIKAIPMVLLVQGETYGGDEIPVPSGFTISQCSFIFQESITNIKISYGDPPEPYTASYLVRKAVPMGDYWEIDIYTHYEPDDGTGEPLDDNAFLHYSIICEKPS
jgi:hypothetical protein